MTRGLHQFADLWIMEGFLLTRIVRSAPVVQCLLARWFLTKRGDAELNLSERVGNAVQFRGSYIYIA